MILLPTDSWDTHLHIFDPQHYPYASSRAYSPRHASYTSLLDFNAALSDGGCPQNIVLVQPSPYGTDNSLILDLLKTHQEEKKLRAIAVIDLDDITVEKVREMDRLGVRGVRINTEAASHLHLNSAGDADKSLEKLINLNVSLVATACPNWLCQVFISSGSWDYLYDTICNSPLIFVADHQGGMKGKSGLQTNPECSDIAHQAGFQALLRLAKQGKVYIKISGFYRSSNDPGPSGGHDDLDPLIRLLAGEVPRQLLWGSDWPHTGSGASRSHATRDLLEPFRQVDIRAVIRNVRRWVGPQVWQYMTVETPAKLFS